MDFFLFIFLNVILPIFITMSVGYIIQYLFVLDMKTLARINLYIFMPAVLFVNVYDSELSGGMVRDVIITTVSVMLLIYAISYGIAKIRGYSVNESSIFVSTTTFFNSGNYSIPLMQMLYANPLGVSIQAIISVTSNIMFFTLGVFTAGKSGGTAKKSFMYVLRMPFIYIIIASIIFKRLDVGIWNPIRQSLDLLNRSFSGIALVTLGAQLRVTKLDFGNSRLYLSSFVRLLIAPAIGYALTLILGIQGITAQVLVIAMGAPTAINVVLTAIELGNDPEYASQTVMTSTVLSAFTMTLVIWLAQTVIPL